MEYFTKSCAIDGLAYIEDVSISFEASLVKSWNEPYSWGQSRGFEMEIDTLNITGVQIGGLVLTQEQATKMFGVEAINRVIEGVSLEDIQ